MTTTETRAASTIGAARLAALRAHVIDLQDGRLAARGAKAPKSVGEYRSTEADIRAIFRTHLPAFLEDHRPGPVPVVIWAHGGLVDKDAGFAIADQQVDWWKRNGVYPIHFVWETGIWSAVHDSLARWATGGRRGWLDDARDNFIEVAARLLGGGGVWNDMKVDAAAASAPGGGARVLAEELARFVREHPTDVSLHAVGHSAGSIFHSHFLPVALEAGVPRFETATFLAPAVRIDTFSEKLLPRAKAGAIERLAVFAMDDATEQDDTCVGLYGKSLLYLVSRSFESDKDTPLLGLEKDIARSRAVAAFLSRPPAEAAELVLAPRDRGPRTGSASRSHGGFDNDVATMDSVLRRVSGRSDIDSFATVAGSREIVVPETVVDDPAAASRAGVSNRRALCIGIDDYPTERDRLRGCVADAKMWREAFAARGFDVTMLVNGEATRDAILTGILDLVSEAAPGDVLAIQYSGHGTTAPDLDGDETAGEESEDEALCPVDFRDGALVIDDDLARIWEVIPSGVSVTLFFDCCHSGEANRAPLAEEPPEDALPRWVALDEDAVAAYRRRRGAAATPERAEALSAVRAVERPARRERRSPRTGREFLFSACRSTEVAWESGGHGDFTRIAAPLLAAPSSTGLRNRDFHRAVLDAFGDRRRQTPEMHGSDVLAGRVLLGPARRSKEAEPSTGSVAVPAGTGAATAGAAGAGADATGPAGLRPTGIGVPADRRATAVAALLRAVADLLET
ncbi:caspase domain-containing protein [Agromyces aurantiacus]|uniref:Caspase domain-containing protein n=1 Tax=Agromyces aurantiacus TaxID=165814 RepID=A0ABV9RBV2_9MICO|nr:caspase family protein [Agromyces aurantiacus]MBM7505363.1 hypothetical protein [Agromyces aurantiacus]